MARRFLPSSFYRDTAGRDAELDICVQRFDGIVRGLHQLLFDIVRRQSSMLAVAGSVLFKLLFVRQIRLPVTG